MNWRTFLALLFFSLMTVKAIAATEAVRIKPFTLAQTHAKGKFEQVKKFVYKRLVLAGFEVIGKYRPYPETEIYIITDKALKKIARKSEYGGFGAALRVSITLTGHDVQVAHNNPLYIGLAYNMNDSLARVTKKLANTLGFIKNFGGKGTLKVDLPRYQYSFGLEGFYGFFELAIHKNYQDAIKKVEAGFVKYANKMSKVYRLDIPGKQQTVFGISLKNDPLKDKYLSDKYVMEVIDHKKLMRSSHLPYEIMVSGKRVIALHPHFRLAINFPDIRMLGKHSFGRLLELPYVYEENFVKLAGGERR